MTQSPKSQKKSLSIVEIFLAFFIIAVLAWVVLSAANPIDRQADARDAQRITDMHALITAVHQYTVDTNGKYPDGVSVDMVETQLGICSAGGSSVCTSAQEKCVDIASSITPYLATLPVDPLIDAQTGLTGYSIRTSETGVVTIRACGAETSELEVSR